MTRSSDIERILAHIGATDMMYREFEIPADPGQARANWELVESATGEPEERPRSAQPEMPPHPPAFTEREIAPPPPAGTGARPEAPGAVRPGTVRPGVPPAAGMPLQSVFARLRGDAPTVDPSEPERHAPKPESETPLSRVFRRLS